MMKYSFDRDLNCIRVTAPDAELNLIANDVSLVLETLPRSGAGAESLTRTVFENIYLDTKFAIFRCNKLWSANDNSADCSFDLPLIMAGLYIHTFKAMRTDIQLGYLRKFLQALGSYIHEMVSDEVIEKLSTLYKQLDQTETSFLYIKYLSDKLRNPRYTAAILRTVSKGQSDRGEASAILQEEQGYSLDKEMNQNDDLIKNLIFNIDSLFSYALFQETAIQLSAELESDTPCFDEIADEMDDLVAYQFA